MRDNELTDNEVLGIGEAAREIAQTTSQRIKAIYDEMYEAKKERRNLEARVQHIAEVIDARNGEQKKIQEAGKRSVKQFLKLIGWLD
jgi:predicted  nucleic acid-binding Zn-ribbon protein